MINVSFPELFDNYMQQDAHEFLNYLLNTVADLLQGDIICIIKWFLICTNLVFLSWSE